MEWSSWTEVSDLNTARERLAGAGNTTAALAFGGRVPSTIGIAATEEWSSPSNTVKTITTS
jgi:hypothetical protein